MVVFPDNLKTWIIGDGYGANPSYDPYYIGKVFMAFIWERISAICDLFFLWAIRNVKYDSFVYSFLEYLQTSFSSSKRFSNITIAIKSHNMV